MDPLSFENDPLLGDLPLLGGDGNGQSEAEEDVDASTALATIEELEPEVQTHRDLQRGALQALVELTARCSSLEIEIDKKHAEAVAANESRDTRGHADLERQVKSLREQLIQKHAEMLTQIESRYQQTLTTLKKNDAAARQKAKQEFEALQKDLKHKYDQTIWLAESVLEAAEGKVAGELKAAVELHASQKEQLDAKENEAITLLARYNQQPPSLSAAATEEEPAVESALPIETPFAQHLESIEAQLHKLATLGISNLMVGAKPYLILFLLLVAAVAGPQIYFKTLDPQWQPVAISAGATLVVGIGLLVMLKSMGRKEVLQVFRPLRASLSAAYLGNDLMVEEAKKKREVDLVSAAQQKKADVQKARDAATPILDRAVKKKDAALAGTAAEIQKRSAENEAQRASALAELERRRLRKEEELKQSYDTQLAKLNQRGTAKAAEVEKIYEAERSALEEKWNAGIARIQAPIAENSAMALPWSDPAWATWKPQKKFPATVRFGHLQIDPKQIIADIATESPFKLPLPATFDVPALMAFPKQASILIHTERTGRADAIRGMQMIMARLLTSLPAGRVRFTLIDPVGLGQNFAGFMHLADYDDALVGGRIWTDAEQIDQRLGNLTEHMETVIQKYLRNEFATIDDYNQQAGELAEPYRFLVISDFPVNFSDEAMRRLSSIATTGARCGVYLLMMRDTRVTNPGGSTHLDDLEAHCINLVREGDRFVWRDKVFSRFPLTLDPPPTDDELSEILHKVGKGAKEANRVEVPFDSIAPKPPQFWTMRSGSELNVAVGRSGATRLQTFRMGKGVAQHALVAGKTGSGKSTLLHALIANLAMWYSPDEVELYLIDFKKGVEFKTYATHELPHARAIAVESDREFGLSVLQRIDGEMTRRGNLYRKFGVQDLASFREASGEVMPRTLLVIDEFQEFFTEDDKLAQDASLLMDRLVRQGRAFGVHVLLGSQTIGGSSGLSRSTIGQIAIRIALMTSEADSQLILGDGNSAARLLSRPGEAIYNDAGGLVEGNSPFQVAWLPDPQRDVFLDQITEKIKTSGYKASVPIVFEGNAAADFRKNLALMEFIDKPRYEPMTAPPQTWVGEPVAIKAPTSVAFRRQSGSNILIIGQNEDAALAMVSLVMVNVAAQLPPESLSFYLMDGTPTDSQTYGVLPKVSTALPHQTKVVDYRAVGEALHELTLEMQKRQAGEMGTVPPAIFLVIYGMQRYRTLRKSEDAFSFSGGDEEKPPDPGKEFADLMREGPAVGIHIIAWIDTATALDRTLDRGAMREFDTRVLFQMSAADSSNLIDSPAANKLGVFRALAYSEEQGSMEKFRPYAQPNAEFLAELKEKLTAKAKAK
ncbi:MAG: FtsK/SpoIIIE domain-containing protein [Planctomycetota bacterium]|nr:FtsK/SpoIIIE domain-containing protein [Planctomycetota bacterium]